jgi:hypothetical protein
MAKKQSKQPQDAAQKGSGDAKDPRAGWVGM